MAEERITTYETPGSAPQTVHTTVIHDSPRRGGGAGWFIALVLLLALVAGIYFFTRTSGAEMAKDKAVSEAASEIGGAANKIGDAAENVGDAARDAAKK